MEQIISRLLEDFETGKMSRRKLIQTLAMGATAMSAMGGIASAAQKPAAASKRLKVVGVNHISYQSPDYARTRDFYRDVLGMTVPMDTGDQCYLQFGDPKSAAGECTIHLRRTERPDNKPYIDHIGYTIENWNRDEVLAELKRMGYAPEADSKYGWGFKDSEGYMLQILAKEHNKYILEECGGYMQGCPKK